ncbi:hypothetical protein VTL71DRAFT_9324 [Oculimacula yallundae]|uniref:Secreted protein n=1 Tax=Oculimacula yallundae TaxID=86028 RepID=A0ABR4BVF1_9HELO
MSIVVADAVAVAVVVAVGDYGASAPEKGIVDGKLFMLFTRRRESNDCGGGGGGAWSWTWSWYWWWCWCLGLGTWAPRAPPRYSRKYNSLIRP